MSVELVCSAAFERTVPELGDPDDREHATSYFYRNAERYRIVNFALDRPRRDVHLAVDTPEHFESVTRIVAAMNRPHWEYSVDEVLRICDKLPTPAELARPRRCSREAVRRGRDRPWRRRSACRGLCEASRLRTGRALRSCRPRSWRRSDQSTPRWREPPTPSKVLADPSIQIVSIATFDDCHHRQVVAALDHGKHVFVEKPLCLNQKEFDDIKSALERHPELTLSSNLILRKSPRFIELKTADRRRSLRRDLSHRGGLSLRPSAQDRERLAG